MKRVLAALAAASWLVACGGGSQTGPQQFDQTQTQKPVSPKGSFVGQVIDVTTGGPLEGATVKVLGSEASVGPTNAEGIFRLDNAVVGSTYTFIVEKTGYSRRRITGTLPVTTGNSPLEGSVVSFSLTLFPLNGTITGHVFLPNGRGAPNATVFVNQASGVESVVTATTDMEGKFTLTGLAASPSGFTHAVIAQWYDENNDMAPDYGSVSQSVSVLPGGTSRAFLTYLTGPQPGAALSQRVISSNVLDGEVAAGDPLTFTFALPVFQGSLEGSATRPWVITHASAPGTPTVPVEGTFNSPTALTIRPSLNSLREGERYTISLNLRNASTASGTDNNFSASFTFQVRAANTMQFMTQVTNVTVTNPTPVTPYPANAFNHNSTTFRVGFTPAAGAVRYQVYARDTTNNPNFVLLTLASGLTDLTANGAARYETDVTLGSPFTSPNFGGGPLSGNNRVTFAVVGIDQYGSRAPLQGAMTVEVRDTIPPTITSGPTLDMPGVTVLDAINDTGSDVVYRLAINYSEPMDPASMVTFTSNAAMAPMSRFEWAPGSATRGYLFLTIRPGVDSTGSFLIRGGRDVAGNELQQAGDRSGILGGRRELLTNNAGEFTAANGMGCMFGAWMPSGTPTPVLVPNNGAVSGSMSGCAALLGSLPGSAPSSGRASLTYAFTTLPAVANTSFRLEASARRRIVYVTNQANPGATYQMRCRVTDPSGMMVFGTIFSDTVTTDNTGAYQANTPVTLPAMVGGQAAQVLCEVENTSMTIPGFGAMYLDEVSVALVKPGLTIAN